MGSSLVVALTIGNRTAAYKRFCAIGCPLMKVAKMPISQAPKAALKNATKKLKKTNKNSNISALQEPFQTWLGGISLECPAPIPAEALTAGERQVEFRVQQQVQPALQHDAYVQILRVTVHIVWHSNLLLLLEMQMFAEYHVYPNSNVLTETAEKLYQAQRTILQATLAAAGHQPPLPSTLSEVKLQ